MHHQQRKKITAGAQLFDCACACMTLNFCINKVLEREPTWLLKHPGQFAVLLSLLLLLLSVQGTAVFCYSWHLVQEHLYSTSSSSRRHSSRILAQDAFEDMAMMCHCPQQIFSHNCGTFM
jgi:hypothetical protein